MLTAQLRGNFVGSQVQVRVGDLLVGQSDVAPEAQTTGLACTAVRRLHDSGAAAGHHDVAGLRERCNK